MSAIAAISRDMLAATFANMQHNVCLCVCAKQCMYLPSFIYISDLLYQSKKKKKKEKKIKKRKSYPRNRPWRPIGLCDVKGPTLSS
jgi:hypothetical protein